ncbi:hypothetical protein M3Y94_01162600 [Aphelenchoides besseyi]|nr:hypothetical protein M3Y94_01162600 [Aphelenchoides besseyi]KAI6228084.1 hypothetical protein M3Y95_00585100 [Aphelenchoides besseyi]
MRWLLRVSFIGGLAILFLIFVLRSSRNSKLTIEQQETDEAIKLLLATDDNVAAAGLPEGNANPGRIRPSAELTFNVAVVLVISLLSVALLITGVIIVAVSLDPGEQHSYESEHDHTPLIGSRRSILIGDEFDDSGGEYNDMAADLEVPDSYQFDPEAQIWSPTLANKKSISD